MSATSDLGPKWLITFAAIAPPSRPAGRQVASLRVGVEETGGVRIAGAGRVHDLDALDGVDDVHLVAVDDNRSLLAARQRRDLAVLAHLLQRVSKLSV